MFFEEQLVTVFLQNPFGESKDHVEPQVVEESGRLDVGRSYCLIQKVDKALTSRTVLGIFLVGPHSPEFPAWESCKITIGEVEV